MADAPKRVSSASTQPRTRIQRPTVAGTAGGPATLQSIAGTTWRLLIVLAGIAVLGVIAGRIFPVIFALFFAMLVTAWTQPLMNLLHRIMPKVIAMILALFAIAVAIIAILTSVIASTVKEGPKLVQSIESGLSILEGWLKTGPLKLDDAQFASLLDQARNAGGAVAKGLIGETLGVLGSLGTLIIAGSVFIFGVIFFLLTPDKVWGWLISWTPKRAQSTVDTSGRIAWESISGYTRGIVVVAFCDALLVFIGLLILQVPLAPALAAVVFLGAFIPVVGAPIATFFAAVVALAERGPVIALLVILLTVIVGSFDGDVLQPLVMGKAVNLHPLAIVFAIAAGGIALGIVGALIAVPIAGALYGVAKYLTGRDSDHPRVPAPT